MTAITQALVVDDSKSARYSLKKMLQKQGVESYFAESAGAALNLLESQKPDVIFMDHLMPGMDGFEATRVIKKNPNTQHIPVVMCTSREGNTYEDEARANGATAILPKPAPEEVLTRILSELADTISIPTPAATQSSTRNKPHESLPKASTPSLDEKITTRLEAARKGMIETVSAALQRDIKTAVAAGVTQQHSVLQQSLTKEITQRVDDVQMQLNTANQSALDESLGSVRKELHHTLSTQINALTNEQIKHSVRAELAKQQQQDLSQDELQSIITDKVSSTLNIQLAQQIQDTLTQQIQSSQADIKTELSRTTTRIQSMAIAGIAMSAIALVLAIVL